MRLSYSSLQKFWKCPRLYELSQYWEPLEKPEAVTTGSLVHAGILDYFTVEPAKNSAGQVLEPPRSNMDLAYERAKNRLALLSANDDRYKALDNAWDRAEKLLDGWVNKHQNEYQPLKVEEPVLYHDGDLEIKAVPDLIAMKDGKVYLVEFKTSASPDYRSYDFERQVDFYSYLIEATMGVSLIERVCFEVISDKEINSFERLPNRDWGKYVFDYLCDFSRYSGNKNHLHNCRPAWDCPNRCDFFQVCWLMETDGWDAASDELDRSFIRKED